MKNVQNNRAPGKSVHDDEGFFKILETIIRGDEYDYETVVLQMTDFAKKAVNISPQHLDLFYRALGVLIDCPREDVGHDAIEPCIAIYENNSVTLKEKVGAIRLLGKALQKDARNPYHGFAVDEMADDFWGGLMMESYEEMEFFQESLRLCGAASKISESLETLNNLTQAIDDCRAQGRMTDGGYALEAFITIGIAMTVPFAKSKNKKTATCAKKYIKEYFAENTYEEADDTTLALLAPARKLQLGC